jgi:hypothetical protein
VILLLLLFVFAAPIWLMQDFFDNSFMFIDDFYYVSVARDFHAFCDSALRPLNCRVVPLFRFWTYLVVALAGKLSALPVALGIASYVGLAVAMALVGLFVFRESGRVAVAIMSMGCAGISTVIEPSVIWFSAGQAIWAGTGVLCALIAVQGWLKWGGLIRLLLAIVCIVAAPGLGTGGLVAGPAVAAYLWAHHQSRWRRAAWISLASSAATGLLLFFLVRGQIASSQAIGNELYGVAGPRPVQALVSTAQALSEFLVFADLGVDVSTSAFQGVILTLNLLVLWVWSRGGLCRLSALEAAGGVTVLLSYLMVYTFRGNLSFNSLRPVTWYHAIPQTGWALFLSGWYLKLSPLPEASVPCSFTVRKALTVVGLTLLVCATQMVRAQRFLRDSVPPLAPSESRAFLHPRAARLRAQFFLAEKSRRQREFLARLEVAEELAKSNGLGQQSIRNSLGRIGIPGIPDQVKEYDAVNLLALPAEGPEIPPGNLRRRLALLLEPIPEQKPPLMQAEGLQDPLAPPLSSRP